MKNKYVRRAVIGLLAGGASSWVLASTCEQGLWGALLAILIGIAAGLVFEPAPRGYLDSIMTTAAMGVPLWGLFSVIIYPLARSEEPLWTAAGMRELFPELVGWLLYGASMGLLLQAMTDGAARWIGPVREIVPPQPVVKTRIVILGGGFGGVSTAEHLEQVFGPDPSVSITLVSDSNALLFTPMLAEVAASSLEATHISTPLRTTLRRTNVIRGEVARVDVDRRRVILASEPSLASDASSEHARRDTELEYDHLVLALGAVSNYLGMKNVEEEAFDFKSLSDAIRIRNHVIDLFERADREPRPETRRTMLTFVIAGGGFAGTELAGALNDFARGMLAYYPNLKPEEVRVLLVHSRERILPELSEPLAAYALERMAARGVAFKLNVRVKDARRGVVILSPDEEIRTETLVWTAGTTPNPVIKSLPFEKDKRGAVRVDQTLQVPEHPFVWALGDCAVVPDGDGKTCPPTAQFAIREAKRLALNLKEFIEGRSPVPFRFKSLGMLCVVGHHTACAEIRGWRFSGLFAWLLWRAIYLMKLPGLERKIRVVVDWAVELFFPRDIVQTIDLAPVRTSPKTPKTEEVMNAFLKN
jgi:NADH dehydrogenase